MIFRYKILYIFYSTSIPRYFINYFYKIIYFYNTKYYIFYPILNPRIDSLILFFILKKCYSFYFLFNLFDFGCGSGLFFLLYFYYFFSSLFFSTDINYLAYKNSLFNFKYFNNNIFNYSWFYFFFNVKKIDIFLSNPPYLSLNDIYLNKFLFFYEFNYSLISYNYGYFDLYSIIFFSYDLISLNGLILIENSNRQSKKIRKFFIIYGFVNICTFSDDSGFKRFNFSEK